MSFLSLLSLLPLLQSSFALASTFPTTLEVDLLFPLNTTYAPTSLFPILVALQNAPLFPTLDPTVDLRIWDITHGNGHNMTSYSPTLPITKTNFTLAETAFMYGFLPNLPVGRYSLVWEFGSGNCSQSTGLFAYTAGVRYHGVEFTVQDGAQAVDIATPLTSDQCAALGNFAFNVTGTLAVEDPALYNGLNTCAVLDANMPIVTGNPCAVSIGAAAASSVQAQITATACGGISQVVSCAPSATTTKKSDAGRRCELGGGGTRMGMGMVMLGCLLAGI